MGHISMKKLINIFTLNFIFIFSVQASMLEDLPEIKYETFKLDNGLTVVVHEDKKVPMVAVNVWYHVGSKNEKVGKTGFAHLFEHLMFNGTENYNSEYFEPFEKLAPLIKMVPLTLTELITFKMFQPML